MLGTLYRSVPPTPAPAYLLSTRQGTNGIVCFSPFDHFGGTLTLIFTSPGALEPSHVTYLVSHHPGGFDINPRGPAHVLSLTEISELFGEFFSFWVCASVVTLDHLT